MKRVVVALLLGIVLSCAIGYLVARHDISRASLSHSVANHFGRFAGVRAPLERRLALRHRLSGAGP